MVMGGWDGDSLVWANIVGVIRVVMVNVSMHVRMNGQMVYVYSVNALYKQKWYFVLFT